MVSAFPPVPFASPVSILHVLCSISSTFRTSSVHTHTPSPPSCLFSLADFWGFFLLPIILCLRGCTRISFLSWHVQFWQSQKWGQGVTRIWEERNQTSGENGKTKPVVFSPSSSVRRLDQRPPEIFLNQNYFRSHFLLPTLSTSSHSSIISCSLDHS